MKSTIIFSLAILLSFPLIAQDDWTIIHPYPTSNDLIDAHFVSDQKGWVVGTSGTILYTDDGGVTWTYQHQDSDEALWSVFFITDSLGWACGWSRIYRTIDAGTNWVELYHPSCMGDLMDVYFINQDTGWIVGTYEIVLKTTNGGDNWTKVSNSLPDHKSFFSVFFTDALHGCAVGGFLLQEEAFIKVSEDGGMTWVETTPLGFNDFNKVFFVDSLTGWACGYEGAVIKTIDGGHSWIDKSIPGVYIPLHGINFFDEMTGIVLEDNTVYLTHDGGENWNETYDIGTSFSQRGMMSYDYNKVVTVGYSGTINKSEDGGITWENLNQEFYYSFSILGFFDELNGMALTGSYGNTQLLTTSDGGFTWQNDTLVNNGPFYRMYLTGQACYLLNNNSQMMETNDGGQTWMLKDIPSVTSYYSDLQFVTPTTGYLCGSQGQLVKTTDGGNTWEDISLYNPYDLRSIFFIDEQNGWMTAYTDRKILRTDDGGDTWSTSTLGESYLNLPMSIYFINELVGFASSFEGMLFKTVDGGENWEEFHGFYSGSSSKILFTTDTEGWYKNGFNIYHTIDGGNTWDEGEYLPQMILSMFFLSPDMGWLGGSSGLIAVYNPTVGIYDFVQVGYSVSLYPNPAHDIISVKLGDFADERMEITIFNMKGEKLIRLENISSPGIQQFNISELANGVYFLQTMTLKGRNLIKFIKN